MKKKAEDILEDYANSYSQADLQTLAKFLDQIRNEAIKEFWEKAKQTREFRTQPYVYIVDGDNLVQEMVGDIPKIEHASLCETDTYKVGEQMNCDEEIIRALKICTNGGLGCGNKCPYFPDERGMHCFTALKMDALDLINRKQAEIEHWKAVTKKGLKDESV